ncbi:ScbR family autoregulator-binding transcription factor [Streptomyces nogalater]
MFSLSGAAEPTSTAARAFVLWRLLVRSICRSLTLLGVPFMARQHRALRTREDLIRSAAEVIDDVGYAEASISAISHRAGVSNGALHFHFKSKRALGEAVELAAARTLLHITGRVPVRHPAPIQLLVDTSKALAGCIVRDPVLRAGFSLGGDPTWQGTVDLWEQWQDWVQLMLVVARDQRALSPDVGIDEAVSIITSFLAGLEVRSRAGAERSPDRSVTGFWRLLLPHLVAEGTAPPVDHEGDTMPLWCTVDFGAGGQEREQVCGVA